MVTAVSEGRIVPPWTDEQVRLLNEWQTVWHPFTCRNDAHRPRPSLLATSDGWVCPECDYTQKWAHAMMADADFIESLKHPYAAWRDDD